MQIPSSTFASNSHKKKQQNQPHISTSNRTYRYPKKHNPVSNSPTYPFLKLTNSSHLKMDGVGIQSFPNLGMARPIFRGTELLLLVSGNFPCHSQPLKLCRSFQGKHSKLTWKNTRWQHVKPGAFGGEAWDPRFGALIAVCLSSKRW